MTLPVSPNAISFSQVNTELGLSSTAQISLNDSAVRTLFGKASGAISMSDGHGKANQFAFTISANQVNANLRSLAVAAGWNQTSAVVATVNSGVWIYSTSTGTPALTINGSFPNGVTLTNNGYIAGMGGAGSTYRLSPNAGGPAISLGVNCTIINNSYIGGGGGGGNTSGPVGFGTGSGPSGGGGAGGGKGGEFAGGGGIGGAGGGIGAAGAAGGMYYWQNGKNTYAIGGGGGGGRIFPGSGGAGGTSPGTGFGGGAGGGGGTLNGQAAGGAGGSGGAVGAAGGGGDSWPAGGGGGWGAAGGMGGTGGGAAGAGGKAIALNGYTATRSGSGSTYGAVS